MILRRPRKDEFEKLVELHKQLEHEFPFPDLNIVSSLWVAVEDDEIVGFGILQPIFESILVLDKTKSKTSRITALAELEERAEYELSSQGITQFHAFVQDKKFFNLLKKRFGFKTTKGIALVKVI